MGVPVAIVLDQIVDNEDGTVTVDSHDDITNQTYVNTIGLDSSPTPGKSQTPQTQQYVLAYIQSTIKAAPQVVYTNPNVVKGP